ncbi:M20/M25/M40 family metallo-hydrolase [Tianweitania populi]|uniref:Arginine utilization protein RocB n=1 Tax=Tianweitania populi TaxID=1607949 RepID=A0A8J3DSP1_9HYPH|nr:M20/M25/M40 family metallo-hydrolase [Tianweitania populi]GHD16974.1 arginine utilization protein RocB [Tianweitania populi]
MVLGREQTAAITRQWALALTEIESVSGGAGEAALGPWLRDALAADPAFGGAECWSFPVREGDGRHCVAMLLRGSGRETLILTGHFDTVSIEDYGELRPLATQPDALAERLKLRLETAAHTAAEQRAKADLASGDFMPGRGLLDMKAGLAAGLAVCADYAADQNRSGNLLFLAVPDEEVNSVGARAAAAMLPQIARDKNLDLVGAVNLDAISDDSEDGHRGRVIALGTIGKVLPTAYVVGVPAHSGFPLAGINAAALAGAIAARVEWAPELTDDSAGETPGTLPSLLSLSDGKPGYDVTTPGTAFASFNVLSYRRSPETVMNSFEALCREAADTFLEGLKKRLAGTRSQDRETVLDRRITLYRYETLLKKAVAVDPNHASLIEQFAGELAASALSLPEQCRRLTERTWMLSGFSGPAIVLGFGSIPYLPTNLSEAPAARKLHQAAEALAKAAQSKYGVSLQTTGHFAGISDMSFFGEADEADLAVVAANTPMWKAGIRWPDQGGVAGVPTINLGPWGRDYHTPLERIHVPYGFDILPRLLIDLTRRVLG